MSDIHADRRIHDLEAQLRKARNDALEEAAQACLRVAENLKPYHVVRGAFASCDAIRALKEVNRG